MRSKSLPEGMLGDQALELADELGVAPQGEIRLEPRLERGEALLLESAHLDLRERRFRKVGERSPAPERMGQPQRLRSRRRRLPTGLLDECLELEDVELLRRNPEEVAGTRARPSSLRSPWTATWSAFAAVCGARSPQSPSISRSRETGSLAWRRRSASRARCRGPPRGSVPRPSFTASRGPRTRNSNCPLVSLTSLDRPVRPP